MLSCTDLCPLFICISCMCMHNDLLQVTCNKEFEFEFMCVWGGGGRIAGDCAISSNPPPTLLASQLASDAALTH